MAEPKSIVGIQNHLLLFITTCNTKNPIACYTFFSFNLLVHNLYFKDLAVLYISDPAAMCQTYELCSDKTHGWIFL
uniref:Uncharacterized protein n=1 Tax=Arundo donax TaxID=35708 RepID=A0A0A9FY60_ARUDO